MRPRRAGRSVFIASVDPVAEYGDQAGFSRAGSTVSPTSRCPLKRATPEVSTSSPGVVAPLEQDTCAAAARSDDEDEVQADDMEIGPGGGETSGRALSAPAQPTKKMIEGHEVSTLPFMSWCAACVRARARSQPHFRRDNCDQGTLSTFFC